MAQVSIRPFFAILIVAAMILSPFVLRGGMAMAATPGNHHAQMSQSHCGAQQGERDAGKVGDNKCCVAMCANMAMRAAVAVEPLSYARSIDRPALSSIGKSFISKLPTPPPRTA